MTQIQGSVTTESLNLTTECLQTCEALQSFCSSLPPIVNYNAQNSSSVIWHEFHINYISRCRPWYVGPCYYHGMARPQFADARTASRYGR